MHFIWVSVGMIMSLTEKGNAGRRGYLGEEKTERYEDELRGSIL